MALPFVLNEYIYSETAKTYNINNFPGADVFESEDFSYEKIISNLEKLHNNVIDPLRLEFGPHTNNADKIFKGLLVIAGIDLASKVLGIAQGISLVLGWLKLTPLAIAGLLFSFGAIGSKSLGGQEQVTLGRLERMEGGVTEENRMILIAEMEKELEDLNVGQIFGGQAVVLKKQIDFLKTGENGSTDIKGN